MSKKKDDSLVQVGVREERGRCIWILAVLEQQYAQEAAYIAGLPERTSADLDRELTCTGASAALKAAIELVKGEAQP